MKGKIALEEHFSLPETRQDSKGFFPDTVWGELRERLLDIQDRRLREMDANGVELMILSLNAPTIQAIPDRTAADELARRANDYLAGEVAKRPDRFKGFAALPMQDPELAAAELQRAVDGGEHPPIVPGLPDEVARAGLHGAHRHADPAVGGDDDHHRLGIVGQDLLEADKPFLARGGATGEVEVEQDDVEALGREPAARLQRALRAGDLDPMAAERQGGGLHHVGVVVDEQDAPGRVRRG